MSTVVWNTTQLVSRVENLTIFSCSSGSLSAMTPPLPKRHQAAKFVVGLGLVGRRGGPGA
jgi:hypothetical protein